MIRTKEDEILVLRKRRETECFSVINRGKIWYNCITDEQLGELNSWYQKWLNVTETMVVPVKPTWINNKIISEEILI